MVKASRRDILRHMFGSSGFELDHDTANEVLMRIRRSLDPIPITDGMWASYRTIRRELQYEMPTRLDPAASTRFCNLPEHIAKDFSILLRIETILRSSEKGPHLIATDLTAEIRAEMECLDNAETCDREVLDGLVRHLLKAAGIADPPDPSL